MKSMHVHHWFIEPPACKKSLGRCQYCGETRMFDNTGPNLPYNAGSDRRYAELQYRHAETRGRGQR